MKVLLNGDEAVAAAAYDAGVALGTGYPGTPSTEIVETFEQFGGNAQWAPNEKVALEVALGVAYAGGRSIATMKHVGLNVAADPLFTAAYTDVDGGIIVISADDPGMASSQNEQDNRRYAVASGVPMFEPSDSQEAYDFTLLAFQISEQWHIPVMLRLTTRVCHSKTIVERRPNAMLAKAINYKKDATTRSMVPAFARPAHKNLRKKLHEIEAWCEAQGPIKKVEGSKSLGIITAAISYQHVRDAAPEASVLKLGLTHPLPMDSIRKFAASVDRCLVVEEGDSYMVEQIRNAGIQVEDKLENYRFGELDVERVRRLIARDTTPEKEPNPGKPPALCPGCPHRVSFETLKALDCIVVNDIGCYGLGTMAPFEAVDVSVCMGSAIPVGLGMRHTLPPDQAKRVVSVLGDSTMLHTGINGIIEAVYNTPETGHVVLLLDNGITAMTGMQEHPGTGRKLDHTRAHKIVIENALTALGVPNVHVIDSVARRDEFVQLVKDSLEKPELTVIIARRECLLAVKQIREYERANAEQCN